jgi:putative glutamine amidotransferase
MSYLPLVGLPADTYENHGFVFHSIGDKYLRAVAEVALCSPVMIPSMVDALELDALLDHFDGIVITGAVSNVHPPYYGEQPSPAHEPYDHARDAVTLKLIEKVIKRGIPLFCICRGFQDIEGRLDHRAPKHDNVDVRYAPAHVINIRPGGLLEKILGKREAMVNSIHRQGIKRLAKGLAVEATAPDGIIEAVSVRDAKGFAIGTQWHPEFKALSNPDSVKLFTAFGNAVRAYAKAHGKTMRTVA